MITAGVVRTMLIVDIVILALFALIYLRQRRMSVLEYCCWGLLVIIVPVIGPFLAIANRPGQWDPSFSINEDLKRLIRWTHNLLPDSPKETRLDRARKRRKKRLGRDS